MPLYLEIKTSALHEVRYSLYTLNSPEPLSDFLAGVSPFSLPVGVPFFGVFPRRGVVGRLLLGPDPMSKIST